MIPWQDMQFVALVCSATRSRVVSSGCNSGASGATGLWLLLAGAFAFYVSDLAVARERFVSSSFLNRAWGLPLYYGAQILLAASVAL